jgi:hypothetical protein
MLVYSLLNRGDTDIIVPETSTFYVATTGNNTDGDGSIMNPWATLSYADSQISPGDTIYIRGGVYNEVVDLTTSGTQNSVITWIAFPGEDPVIDGYGLGVGWTGLVRINQGIGYVVWDGIGVYRSGGTGIMVQTDSHNITIQNCVVEDTQGSGIMGYSDSDEGYGPVRNLTIYKCEVYNANQSLDQEAISMSGVDGVEVSYCIIHDSYKEGIDFKRSTNNGYMHHNVVFNMTQVAYYVDSYDTFCSNIYVHSNIAFNCTSVGISLATEKGGTLDNIKVYNNLVYNCKDGLSIIDYTASPGNHSKTNVQIYNNTFVDNSRFQIWILDPAVNFIDLVVQNNIFAHSNATNVFDWDDWQSLIGATLGYNLFQAGTGFGSPIITGDPLFQNRGNNNYSLSASSPAVDAASTAYSLLEDIDGNVRPSGNAYDIGAYELQGTQPTNQPSDVNNDGVVNVLDLINVGQHWEETGPVGWRSEAISHYVDKSIYLDLN